MVDKTANNQLSTTLPGKRTVLPFEQNSGPARLGFDRLPITLYIPSTIFNSKVSILGIYFITGLIKSTVDICIHIIVIILHSKLQTDEDELPACFKFQLRLVEQKNSKYSLAVWIT